MNRDDTARLFAKGEARLTAYALDELRPDEQAEVRSELARSHDLRSELEAIRKITAQLKREFDHARRRVESDSEDLPARQAAGAAFRSPGGKASIAFAIATSILAILGWGMWPSGQRGNSGRVRSQAEAVSVGARTSGLPTPSLHYDLPDAELHLAMVTGSPRLAYDSPVRVANVDERLLSFSVGYQRDF